MPSRPTPSPTPRRNPPPKAAARLPYHHGDLARALVVAATRLIATGHGARLTLRAAAEAAGVSVAAPYRHFADREALLAAVLAEGFRELARRTEAARRGAPDPAAGLLETGLAYVRFASEHPQVYRLMFGPECDKAAHPDLLEAGRTAHAVLLDAVADCGRAGLLPEAAVEQVALLGWSLSHGLASLHADGLLAGTPAAADIGATARAMMTQVIQGLLARPAPAAARRRAR